MTALKNVYARLITKAKQSNDTAALETLPVKIGSACAVGLLTDEEQAELIEELN